MSDLFPSETMKVLEASYQQLRAQGLSHRDAAAMLKEAMSKSIPAAVNMVMDEMRARGAFGDPREAREVERHQREDEQ